MSRLLLSTALAGLVLGISGPAVASDMDSDQQQAQPEIEIQQQPQTAETVVASDVMGMTLASVDGRELGEVEDIVFDMQGQYYLMVSQGGFLGIGGETRLVPMDRVSYGEDALVVLSESDLMEGYDPNAYMSVDPNFEINTGH